MILRDKRKRLGYTLEEMARKLNTTPQTIQRYETNKRYPHATELLKIARVFELSDRELIEYLKEIENN